METYIAIALSLVAVILSIVILTKVNKVLDNLHTPIVKKLTPDMNLKPNSRRPVGAQEMAQRGERNNNKDHGKDRQNNKEARGDKQAQPAQNRDRNEQRGDRGQRRDRREGRPERQRRDFNKPAAEAPVVATPTEFDPNKVRYGRRNVIKKLPELGDDA